MSAGMYDRPMSEAIAFDTHRFVKRLTESGFTEKQAETLAEEHVDLLNANLATKADVAKVEASVEALRQETRAAIEAVKVDLLKWLFGALIAQGGLIVGKRSVCPWRCWSARRFASAKPMIAGAILAAERALPIPSERPGRMSLRGLLGRGRRAVSAHSSAPNRACTSRW